jgi:hypothetical protein
MEASMNRAFPLALAATLLLTSCTTMEVVEKNLEEGRLVPEAAVASGDFLNEYRHPLAPPRRSPADLDIALERKTVLVQGGKVLVQVGISTAPPALKPVDVHALAFVPADAGRNELDRLTNAVAAMRRHTRGAFAIDHARKDGNLKDFLAAFVRRPFDDGEHHVVLLVGSYKGFLDLPGLSERERQDVVDLARILAAKSVTVSVLSVGDKPDFGMLRQLAERGRGTFHVATESLDYDAWIKEDLRARSAETLGEIQVALKTKNGARLCRVLAPRDLRYTDQGLAYDVKALKQGHQRVLLAELEIPAKGEFPATEALDVDLKYYVPSAKRYYNAHETVGIQYVYDPNLALPHGNHAIERSLLILKTEDTLRSVAREVRDRRNYQAIALLTAQSRALKQAGEERKDRELARDATILAKYADRLYEFDGEWFKSVKIWRDLSWDTDRFRNVYR